MYVGCDSEWVHFLILNSYVCRIRHIIPKWNTLFEKDCISAAEHNHYHGLFFIPIAADASTKFDYFIQPHECSCILQAHNLIMRIIKIFQIGISCLGVSCGCHGCGCGCEVCVCVCVTWPPDDWILPTTCLSRPRAVLPATLGAAVNKD
jgi:hypothetical protein